VAHQSEFVIQGSRRSPLFSPLIWMDLAQNKEEVSLSEMPPESANSIQNPDSNDSIEPLKFLCLSPRRNLRDGMSRRIIWSSFWKNKLK
jgi:hypothetical protein